MMITVIIRDTRSVILRIFVSIIDELPVYKGPGPLIEFKLLPGGYQQEGNRKNNICKGINVPEQHYYVENDLRLAKKTCLVSPFIEDLINKKHYKSDTDEKIRASQQVSVLMRDHKIDLIDAEQHGKKGVEKTEIGRKTGDITQNEVFVDPDQEKRNEKAVENGFSRLQQTPDMKLPRDEDTFRQRIDIGGNSIAVVEDLYQVAIDGFRNDRHDDQDKKGLIPSDNTTPAYQPYYKRD